MKIPNQSVIEVLVQKLREQELRFNPALETAPVAVLWTDEKNDWETVLPRIKSGMAELFSLSATHNAAKRAGPGVWLHR